MSWEAMIACLVTTQQRSGPNSAVTKFICTKPFPLNYPICKKADNLSNVVEGIIKGFGGLRRGKTIGEEVEYNFKWLEKDGWQVIYGIIGDLKDNQDAVIERKAAEIIMDNLMGFWPQTVEESFAVIGPH